MTSFYQTRSRILSSNWDRSEETGPVMEESQQWLMLGLVEGGLVSLGRAGLESWWADGPWVTVRNHRSRCHAPQSRHSPDCPRSSVKATVATNWFLKSRFFKEHPGRWTEEIKLLFRLFHLIDIITDLPQNMRQLIIRSASHEERNQIISDFLLLCCHPASFSKGCLSHPISVWSFWSSNCLPLDLDSEIKVCQRVHSPSGNKEITDITP